LTKPDEMMKTGRRDENTVFIYKIQQLACYKL